MPGTTTGISIALWLCAVLCGTCVVAALHAIKTFRQRRRSTGGGYKKRPRKASR